MFVIQRIKDGEANAGKYVAITGQGDNRGRSSYTRKLENARRYTTKAAALADLCPDSEQVVEPLAS